jgi:hypothetical protein
VPQYYEYLRDPKNPVNKSIGRRSVDLCHIKIDPSFAGSRSHTPSRIPLRGDATVRPDDHSRSYDNAVSHGTEPAEALPFGLSSYYRPAIRVNINNKENLKPPDGYRKRPPCRKPVPVPLSGNSVHLFGHTVVSAPDPRPLGHRRHFTPDQLTWFPGRSAGRLCKEHPVISARMRAGNGMSQILQHS